MDRITPIRHRGKLILQIDFSNCTPEEHISAMEEAKLVIAQYPPASLLTLTLFVNSHFNNASAEALKSYVAHNARYVRANAVVGVIGMKRFLFALVKPLTSARMGAFTDVEAAKDWLVEE